MLRWFSMIAREPFFQFMLLGFAIWSGVQYRNTVDTRYTIHVGPAERQLIAMKYEWQFGQPPTADQLHSLIDRYVKEEIFLREGLALKLDQNDEIVRRRIIQKYEFLQTDLQVTDAVAPEELRRWFERNHSRYVVPDRIALSHVYFSNNENDHQTARERAVRALRALRAIPSSRAPELGDPFPGPADIGAISEQEAARLFGDSELSRKLFGLPIQQWSGPYRSGYGWHLVYVTGRSPAGIPPLAAVEARVLADYQEEQRALSDARVFERLREKYTIRTGEES